MHAGDLVTDARDIGALYLQSFPESIDFFFPGRDPDTLLPMIGWGFELLLRTGCHRIVIRDCDGSLLDYCLVSTTKTVPFTGCCGLTGSYGRWSLGIRAARQIQVRELPLLVRNGLALLRISLGSGKDALALPGDESSLSPFLPRPEVGVLALRCSLWLCSSLKADKFPTPTLRYDQVTKRLASSTRVWFPRDRTQPRRPGPLDTNAAGKQDRSGSQRVPVRDSSRIVRLLRLSWQ